MNVDFGSSLCSSPVAPVARRSLSASMTSAGGLELPPRSLRNFVSAPEPAMETALERRVKVGWGSELGGWGTGGGTDQSRHDVSSSGPVASHSERR